jgi:hypothetical protein
LPLANLRRRVKSSSVSVRSPRRGVCMGKSVPVERDPPEAAGGSLPRGAGARRSMVCACGGEGGPPGSGMCGGQLRTRDARLVGRTCEHVAGAQMRGHYVVDSGGGQAHGGESIQTACRACASSPMSPQVMPISVRHAAAIAVASQALSQCQPLASPAKGGVPAARRGHHFTRRNGHTAPEATEVAKMKHGGRLQNPTPPQQPTHGRARARPV